MHDDDQVAKIAASMVKFDWTVPCMVADNGELIAGHGFFADNETTDQFKPISNTIGLVQSL